MNITKESEEMTSSILERARKFNKPNVAKRISIMGLSYVREAVQEDIEELTGKMFTSKRVKVLKKVLDYINEAEEIVVTKSEEDRLEFFDTEAKCVQSSKNLTLGKRYEIYWVSDAGYVAVKNDAGKVVAYNPQRFDFVPSDLNTTFVTDSDEIDD